MSTTFPKANDINRKWYVIDAAGKPMGRVAAKAAALLRGKHKPIFTPNVDCGDHVIILNSDKVVLTGNKMEAKMHYHHSGWVGGLKSEKYAIFMKNRSDEAVMLAVKGMLPDNALGHKALTRLRVYKGNKHENAAQKPEVCEL